MIMNEDEDQMAPWYFSNFDTQVVLHGLAVDSVAWLTFQALGSFIGHVYNPSIAVLNQGRIALFLGATPFRGGLPVFG